MAQQDRMIAKPVEVSKAEVPAPQPVSPQTVPSAKPKGLRKKSVLLVAALGLAALAGTYGRDYWTTGRFMITTNDAYVTADITLISSRVQGYVADVAVAENDVVKAGDILVRLDDGDFAIALQVSQSRVASASETLNRIDAQILAAQAGVASAQAQQDMALAEVRAATTNADRVGSLATQRIASQAQLDTATEGLDTATAGVAIADAAVANAQAQIGVLRAQRAEAVGSQKEMELAAAQAQRNLDLTVLRAPAAGTVANLALKTGDLVSPGTRLAALVPLDTLYVEANFKETQLAGIAIGAPAMITIDALPGVRFEGTVVSIAPATGSVFSLLPADNATGNFTKVVQRVPVRIAIPQAALAMGGMRAGLSATIEVDNRTAEAAPAAAVKAVE